MQALSASTDSQSIFINGGSSPTGRALVRLLVAAGHRVTATVLNSSEAGQVRQDGALPAYPGLKRAGELRSAITAAKATVVVNLAPTYPYQAPHKVASWDDYTSVVDDGTAAALEAAHALEIEFFVQGSFSFLGGDPQDHGDHEAPSAPFIDAAQRAEVLVTKSGLASCILRYGFIYSAESPALHSLRDTLLRGRSFLTGSNHARANWIHAIDAARATALAIAARPAGETLDIVDDRPVTPADFVETFAGLLGVTTPAQPPVFAQNLMAGAAQRALLAQPSGASNAAAKSRLGWSLQYPTLNAGLEQSLMVWRATEPIRA